ncbi:MAG TPA: 4-hydroxy-tetrahydrodipicolinate synthase [Anaerolineae bacterium]|nr:4-hydroxy-tetrahydrodipicolinate synthase [Anaerolineae bacterium]
MSRELKGIIVAMITPMNEDESVDVAGLQAVTRYLIGHGVHGLFPGGSQGEFFALTTDERQRILEATLEAAAGEVFIVAHVGAVTTREARTLARHAEQAGADAVAACTPYFVKPSQEELYEYYRSICAAVSLPVLAYDNVGRTGVPLPPSLVARIARATPNFAGIKDSSGDLTQLAEHIRLCPPGFRVFVGRDSLIYAALLHGGVGAVTATANVVPDLAVGIYDAVCCGDLERARELQQKLLPVRLAFGLGTFPVVVKEAMRLIGQPAGPARDPVGPMSDQARAELSAVLKEAGVL